MMILCFFFFNDTATPEIYTLSLHDALPICRVAGRAEPPAEQVARRAQQRTARPRQRSLVARHVPVPALVAEELELVALVRRKRSEEHTSELQSRQYLVCRLLLEKKKNNTSI